MRTALLALAAVLACQLPVEAGPEISQSRAHQLATCYFARYFPSGGCGGAALPTLQGDHWESVVGLGYASKPGGTIRVDRPTGKVSYDGPFQPKPTVSADSPDRWGVLRKRRAQSLSGRHTLVSLGGSRK